MTTGNTTDWPTAMNWRSELEAIIDAVPPDQVPDAIGALERSKAALYSRLFNGSTAPTLEPHLDVKQVATLLEVGQRWVYRHKTKLGGVTLSGTALRFPTSAVQRYLDRRRA